MVSGRVPDAGYGIRSHGRAPARRADSGPIRSVVPSAWGDIVLTLEEGARRVVQTCADVRPDERALILYDRMSNAAPAWALRRAASTLGANAHVRYLDHTREDSDADAFAQVVDELADVDVVIAFTRSSVLTSPAAHLVVTRGCRLFTMTEADERMLTHGAIEADFATLAPRCEFLAERLSDATEAEISTATGTKVQMSLRDRSGVPNPPARQRPGVFRAPYAGVLVAPVEESVEGTVVVDASTSFGLVDSPVTIVLDRGRAVAVTGGAAAGRIERHLAEADSPTAALVGVIGFGMNDAATLHGAASQHAAVAGTGHLCLGANRGIGGANDGSSVLELVYTRPTLLLNGIEVMRAGRLDAI